MEKTCTKCGETKPISAFVVDRSRKDGRFPWCRECSHERYRKKGPRKRYNRLTGCPIWGCHAFDRKQGPTVPGAKRHVMAAHGPIAYEAVDWDSFRLYPRPRGSGLLEVFGSDSD